MRMRKLILPTTSISISHILCIFNLNIINRVTADYCEFGTCNEDQYCCGENKCCQKTIEVWYFWAKVFLLIVIAAFFLLCIFLRAKQLWKYNSYKKLAVEETIVTAP